MRNKILIFISTCVLALTIFIINVGAATAVEIASEEDWNKLADQTSVNGNYKLTANISVSKAIKSFKGTFDGGKKQITFSIQSGDVAPFLEVTVTTTITNLYTYLGRGSSADNYAGGIVAHTAVEGANFKLSTVEGNNYIASHDSFILWRIIEVLR